MSLNFIICSEYVLVMLYKSFAQAWMIILMALSIDFPKINANPCFSEVSSVGWGVLLYKDFA